MIALDSNFLVYFFEIGHAPEDDTKIMAAQQLLGELGRCTKIMIPVQVCGELYNVAVRSKRTLEVARAMVRRLQFEFDLIGSDSSTLNAALDLATDHKLQFWDALILSAAADAGCTILLSEDLQSGFTWRGVRVVDPFAKKMDVRLKRLLGG
jgi:predicted nucleic acid-binding protein